MARSNFPHTRSHICSRRASPGAAEYFIMKKGYVGVNPLPRTSFLFLPFEPFFRSLCFSPRLLFILQLFTFGLQQDQE